MNSGDDDTQVIVLAGARNTWYKSFVDQVQFGYLWGDDIFTGFDLQDSEITEACQILNSSINDY